MEPVLKAEKKPLILPPVQGPATVWESPAYLKNKAEKRDGLEASAIEVKVVGFELYRFRNITTAMLRGADNRTYRLTVPIGASDGVDPNKITAFDERSDVQFYPFVRKLIAEAADREGKVIIRAPLPRKGREPEAAISVRAEEYTGLKTPINIRLMIPTKEVIAPPVFGGRSTPPEGGVEVYRAEIITGTQSSSTRR